MECKVNLKDYKELTCKPASAVTINNEHTLREIGELFYNTCWLKNYIRIGNEISFLFSC